MLESLINLYRQLGGLGAGICLFILFLFVGALYTNILLRRKYIALSEELAGFCAGAYDAFHSDILQWMTDEYKEAAMGGASSVNTLSIIDTGFQAYLKPYMIAERFLKKANALMITTGLFGTFVGLTYAVGNIGNVMANTSADALMQDTGSNTLSLLVTAFKGMAVAFVTSLFGTGFSIIHIIVLSLFSSSGAKSLLSSQLEEYLDIKLASGINAEKLKESTQESEKNAKVTDGIAESARTFETAIMHFSESLKGLEHFNEALSTNVEGISQSALHLGGSLDKTSETVLESGARINGCTERLQSVTGEISIINRRMENMISVLHELKQVTEDSKKDRELFLKSVYEIPDKLLNYNEAAVAKTDRRQVKG